MSLSKVLEEMKRIRPVSEEEIENGPAETARARSGRKAQAIERLKTLKREYSDTLLRSAIFILTVGSEREAFEKATTTEGSCLLSQVDSFYEDLAGRIHPTLYAGKNPGANLFDVVGRHLEDKARELGMLEYPQLIFKTQYQRMISGQADFTNLLKQAVTEQVGGEVVGINAVRTLTDTAIANGHSATVTPIVLSTSDEKFALQLIPHLERLTPRVYLVVAGEASESIKATEGAIVLSEVSSKSMKSALKQIRNSLKK